MEKSEASEKKLLTTLYKISSMQQSNKSECSHNVSYFVS